MNPRPWWPALRRAGVSLLTAAVILAAGVPAVAPLAAQEEIFTRGNQLYQAEDYAAAIEAYEAILAGGFESHELYYNLGNAYFKVGDLGRSILSWERALKLEPGDQDAVANLALAAQLTADEIEPLPRFWLLSVVSWWVNLLPRSALTLLVAVGWMSLAAGLTVRILARAFTPRRVGTWLVLGGASVVLVLGTNLLVRELGIGQVERGVILADAVPVRSAPAEDDNLTLFEVHEGTRVRIDQRTERWAEIVLDDGKVGWVPVGVMGVI
jgi:tetratricopeptide (TPR) repeat protein